MNFQIYIIFVKGVIQVDMNREKRYQITKERNESDMICEKIIDTKPTDKEKIEKIGELVRVAEQKQGRTTIDINKLNKILWEIEK